MGTRLVGSGIDLKRVPENGLVESMEFTLHKCLDHA